MPFLPVRIYGERPTLDIHSQQSDWVARVDIEMGSSAVAFLELSQQREAPHVTPPKSVSSTWRWQITKNFTSASAPMPSASRPGWSIPPGPRTTFSQSLTSTPKNEIHRSQNVKSIKNENIITFIPFGCHFCSYEHMVDCMSQDSRTWHAAAVSLLAVRSDALRLSEQCLTLLCREGTVVARSTGDPSPGAGSEPLTCIP